MNGLGPKLDFQAVFPEQDSGNTVQADEIGARGKGDCRRARVWHVSGLPDAPSRKIHDRQMVILDRSDWSAWLEQTGNEADLLLPLPAGSLHVDQVR